MEGCKFSGGIEKANLILSTGILRRGWLSISELQPNSQLDFTIKNFRKFTIVAFNSQSRPQDLQHTNTLDSLDPTHPLGFLITKNNLSISLHSSSLSAFLHLLQSTDLKTKLKTLTEKRQPQLILVGQSLGGSIAALFTLWLLKNRSSTSLPICITYGSPLIGDDGLRKAISNVEQWKAQFWHLVSHDDAVPRLFVVPKLAAQVASDSCGRQFKPFGTFFLISEWGCACIDDSDSVLELLNATSPNFGGLDLTQLQPKNYGDALQQLEKKVVYRNNTKVVGLQESLTVDLALQLEAVGIGANHQERHKLLGAMETREREVHFKRSALNPSRRLNEVKKQLARLEWYKKKCEANNTTYYDCYKSRTIERDFDVIKFKNILSSYWKDKVEEAENKSQLPDVPMRVRWLFGGVTYKRLVEPLDIADHYRLKHGRGNYMAKRAPHYKLLEKWHAEDDKTDQKKKKKDKATSLTDDSCFWAHVEEAALRLSELKRGGTEGGKGVEDLRKELIEFEGYVMKLVDNFDLSTEVFLEYSSFMAWWSQYEDKLEPGYSSPFVAFMRNKGYVNYK